jgi:hypothetical protein
MLSFWSCSREEKETVERAMIRPLERSVIRPSLMLRYVHLCAECPNASVPYKRSQHWKSFRCGNPDLKEIALWKSGTSDIMTTYPIHGAEPSWEADSRSGYQTQRCTAVFTGARHRSSVQSTSNTLCA